MKNIDLWVLSKSTNKWSELAFAATPGGSAFASDFGNNGNVGVTVTDESNNGGGIGVTAGDEFNNYHFWSPRTNINPNDIAGVYAKFESRLVLKDPNGVDDRAQAHYIARAGADYWRDLNAGWVSDWSNNGGGGGGRFKFVTNNWQNFSMKTLTADQLLQNPPPVAV